MGAFGTGQLNAKTPFTKKQPRVLVAEIGSHDQAGRGQSSKTEGSWVGDSGRLGMWVVKAG